jgi:hypothetical protein
VEAARGRALGLASRGVVQLDQREVHDTWNSPAAWSGF